MSERSVTQLFTTHPASVGESYTEHFGVAIRYSGKMFAAGFCALVHAILPFMFEKTASGIVRKMVADMDRRTAKPAQAPQIVAAE
ncbi:MAG: DUF6356 family protein [Bosea sp. (in: a-proteobacteria)]